MLDLRIRRIALAATGVLLAAGTLAATAQGGAFSGTNGRVAYEWTPSYVTGAGGGSEVFTAAADGTDARELVTGDADNTAARDPSVSSDGRFVAYVRSGYDQEAQTWWSRVHVIGIDGQGDRVLVPGHDAMAAPAWSPDGTRIAYVENVDGAWRLMIADASGATPPVAVGLGEFEGNVLNPQWSPDGRYIAFDDGSDLYIAAVSGGEPDHLADASWDHSTFPNWSPDGTRIVYQLYGETHGIVVAGVQDGRFSAQETDLVAHGSYPRRPAFSPDGKRIIFGDQTDQPVGVVLAKEGLYRLVTIDAAGTEEPKPFLAGPQDDISRSAPDWGPATPVRPATVDTPAAVVVDGGAVAGVTQRQCGSRRNFKIRLRPQGVRIVRARVIVNGRRVTARPGARWLASVDLRTLPKSTFSVDITVWTKSGKRYHETRRYRTCTPARNARA